MRKLVTAHTDISETLRQAIQTAGDAGDEVSAGLLTDRLEWHEKELWMMKAGQR